MKWKTGPEINPKGVLVKNSLQAPPQLEPVIVRFFPVCVWLEVLIVLGP